MMNKSLFLFEDASAVRYYLQFVMESVAVEVRPTLSGLVSPSRQSKGCGFTPALPAPNRRTGVSAADLSAFRDLLLGGLACNALR